MGRSTQSSSSTCSNAPNIKEPSFEKKSSFPEGPEHTSINCSFSTPLKRLMPKPSHSVPPLNDHQLPNEVTPASGRGEHPQSLSHPQQSSANLSPSKSVRFEGKAVSRRGGRYGSPAVVVSNSSISSTSSSSSSSSTTFSSPNLVVGPRTTTTNANTSPTRYRSPARDIPNLYSKDSFTSTAASTNTGESPTKNHRRPDFTPSQIHVKDILNHSTATSPLADSETCSPNKISRTASNCSNGGDSIRTSTSTPAPIITSTASTNHEEPQRRNVTFSPSPSGNGNDDDAKSKKGDPAQQTPAARSPNFHNLPTLLDAKLNSPCGIFLSPCPSSPTTSNHRSNPAQEVKDRWQSTNNKSTSATEASSSTDNGQTSSTTTNARVATPTDFSVDFGKGHVVSTSFDASNVLAWLQSPTANGLFSPGGGLGSALNTPRSGGTGTLAPNSSGAPRTPTISTSFFFSDVASLPRGDTGTSNTASSTGGGASGGSLNGQYPKRMSSMISISPLASSKRRFDVISSSPKNRPRSLPSLLGDESPAVSKDAVERDLMEDEDLSVLLKLASHNNTPRSKEGSDVFRSPRGRKTDYRDSSNPALQLPIIGGKDNGRSVSTKLSQKKRGQSVTEAANAEDFTPPPLGIRSSSSGASREIVYSSARPAGDDEEGGKSDDRRKSKNPSKSTYPHMYHHHRPHPEAPHPYYPGTAPMPPGGSMRVVVGGPPPMTSRPGSKKTGAASPPSSRQGANSPASATNPAPTSGTGSSAPPPYPLPPDGYGPPPPPGSMYPPPHYHPPPPHMAPGMVPYHYPPPPRHVPVYPPTRTGSSGSKSSTKGASGGGKKKKNKGQTAKRPLPTSSSSHKTPTPKKKKTSPRSAGSSSKKTRRSSPSSSMNPSDHSQQQPQQHQQEQANATTTTSSGPLDRQKSAATIAAVNAASGGKNDRAAALAAAILRGVTMRPSGKWQAQLYYAGKSRYIGVFDTREKAALAYEIAREKLKDGKSSGSDSAKDTENAVNAARKAAFEGVNEKDPRLASKTS